MHCSCYSCEQYSNDITTQGKDHIELDCTNSEFKIYIYNNFRTFLNGNENIFSLFYRSI